jgi:hypothetical protein
VASGASNGSERKGTSRANVSKKMVIGEPVFREGPKSLLYENVPLAIE